MGRSRRRAGGGVLGEGAAAEAEARRRELRRGGGDIAEKKYLVRDLCQRKGGKSDRSRVLLRACTTPPHKEKGEGNRDVIRQLSRQVASGERSPVQESGTLKEGRTLTCSDPDHTSLEHRPDPTVFTVGSGTVSTQSRG